MTIASDGSLMDICQAFSFPPSKIAALPAGAQQRRCFVVPTQLDVGITHPKLKGLAIIDVVLSTHSPCLRGSQSLTHIFTNIHPHVGSVRPKHDIGSDLVYVCFEF